MYYLDPQHWCQCRTTGVKNKNEVKKKEKERNFKNRIGTHNLEKIKQLLLLLLYDILLEYEKIIPLDE